MSKARPKFRIGDTVTYCGNRHYRHIVIRRYWDADYPGWRYKVQARPGFFSTGRNAWIAAAWAPIESELVRVKRSADRER